MTFEEFLAVELAPLSRYARALTGDRDVAHDVLADALVRAQLRWSRIAAVERPAAYVRVMVTNGFFSYKRSWASRFIGVAHSGELPEQAASAGVGPVDDRQQLDQLLRTLPRRQRAAIVLRYYLDLPDADIAAELGCTESAVRSYISRGLAAVRSQAAGATAGASVGPSPSCRPQPRHRDAAPTTVIGDH